MWLNKWTLGVGAIALTASAASAQSYNEDFEGLALGVLQGQDVWVQWSGIPDPFNHVVNTQAQSGSQSASIEAGTDTVCDLDIVGHNGATTFEAGSWVLSGFVMIPSAPVPQGHTYFIVMNDFDAPTGTYEWNVQLQMDLDAMQVNCDCGTNGTLAGPALVADTWTEIRAEYQLDAVPPNVDIYWGGTYIASYDPTKGVFGGNNYTAARIDAMDLYPDAPSFPNTTPVYYDDFGINPAGPQPVGTAGCFGDGSGTACPCGNTGGAGEGCQNSSLSGSTLSAVGSGNANDDDLTFSGANLLPGQPALLFNGDNAINGGNGIVFGDGLRCVGQNVVRLGVRVPDVNGDASWGPQHPNKNWNNGDTKHFQTWYRDPAGPCGTGFNLGNRVSITFQ